MKMKKRNKVFNLADLQSSSDTLEDFKKEYDIKLGIKPPYDPFAGLNRCCSEISNFERWNVEKIPNTAKENGVEYIYFCFNGNYRPTKQRKDNVFIFFTDNGRYFLKTFLPLFLGGVHFLRLPTLIVPKEGSTNKEKQTKPFNLNEPDKFSPFLNLNPMEVDVDDKKYLLKVMIPEAFYTRKYLTYIPDYNKVLKFV